MIALGFFVVLVATVLGIFWNGFVRDRRPVFPKKPRQDEVINLIWFQMFGVKTKWYCWWRTRPPTIDWVEGARLQDKDGRAWHVSWDPDGPGPVPAQTMYVQGLSFPGHAYSQVGWFADTTSFAGTALVHELWHDYLDLTKGDDDPQHKDPAFQVGGFVDQCNAKLRALGY